jgi:hypothetical protein
MLEPVTVVERQTSLDPSRTAVGDVLEASDYSRLPADRDYKALISTLPHINVSYHGDPINVGGSTGLENSYYIDGVNVTAPLNGATSINLPYNFIRSVEVRTGGYEAQYGGALGAIVNAITHTGSNVFESNVFAFFTHDALAAKPRAQPVLKEARFYNYDVGARISGPLIRDRLWYSAAWNPRVDNSDKVVGSLGTHAQKSTTQVFAGKLTWRPAKQANVELSVFGDPSETDRVSIADWLSTFEPDNVDPYLQKARTGGVTTALRSSVITRSGVLLEADISYSYFRDGFSWATRRGEESIVADYLHKTVSGGLAWVQSNKQKNTAGMVRATVSPGAHTFSGGVQYDDSRDRNYFDNPGLGYIERYDSLTYTVYDQRTEGRVRNRTPAAYLQDSWRISDRFTLNPGLRWSSQYLSGTSGKTAQRFTNEWQPRIGFNWQLGREGRHRVFGSYGRYYQRELLNIATLYFIDYKGIIKTYSGNPAVAGAILHDSSNFSTLASQYSGSVPDANVENHDEFSAGYERLLGTRGRVSLRALHRNLRSTFQQAVDSAGQFVLGSAGSRSLAFLPDPVRRYRALEANFEGSVQRLQYRGSYVLSRNYGNFTGLFASDISLLNPGNNPTFATVHARRNTTGLLPNDRTHVMKASAAYSISSTFSVGTLFSWMSGTPLSEMGSRDFFPVFLSKRGTAGRTPNIWDLNLRVAHERRTRRVIVRVVGDMLHLGNPKGIVRQEMMHYLNSDASGNPTNLNENYLRPTLFQPPMTARIGIEITPR